MKQKITIIVSVILVATLSACASTTEEPEELTNARTAVNQMQSEPLVLQFENDAEKAIDELSKAEKLFSERKSMDLIKHRAYLAKQYAILVNTQADNVRAREQVADADQRRQELLLRSRERDARRAEASAERSQLEAERALAVAELQSARAERTAEEAEALKDEIEELKAEQTERGLVLTLTDILFDTNESTLKPGAARAMDKLADYLAKSESSTIVIEGHTDSRGSEALNQQLSKSRATSIREALVQRGIDDSRISAVGKGEAFPVASNETSAGRQQNRRVEVIVSSE